MEDFVNSYKSSTKPYRVGKQEYPRLQFDSPGESAEFCELWEIHDRRTGKVFVLATGHDKFLRNDPDGLQVNGMLPFVSFSLVPRARSFWVTPDAFFLKHAQAELSDISLQGSKQRRTSVLKLLIQEGMIEESEKDKLLSSEVGAVVMVKPAGAGTLDQVVKIFNPVGVNQGLQADGEYVRRNARGMVGFSRNQQGEFENVGRRTATEANLVAQGSENRLSRRQVVIRDTYVAMMRRINEIIFRYWKVPRTIQVVGVDGVEKWMTFVGSAIRGNYDYDVQFTSTMQQTPESAAQQGLQMYAALLQDPMVDQVQLRSFLLRSFRNNPLFAKLFTPGALQNAGLRLPMQGMPGAGGAPAGNQGAPQGSQMP
jgi:hypothetical protein